MSFLKRLMGSGDINAPPMPSAKEHIVLTSLLSNQEKYGLQLVAESNGELKKGTVYVLLNRMEDKGYITSRKEEPVPDAIGPARRLYRITGHGRRVVDAWSQIAAMAAGATR